MSLTGSVMLQEGWFIIILKWTCFIRLVWTEYLSLWISYDKKIIINIRVVYKKSNETREMTMGGKNICLTILYGMVNEEPGIFPFFVETLVQSRQLTHYFTNGKSLTLQSLLRPLLGRIKLFNFQSGPSSLSCKLLWGETLSRFLLTCSWWQMESCFKEKSTMYLQSF